MVRCIDCIKLEKCAKTSGKPRIAEVVPGCEDGKRKPITNGDKIRAMSDEELDKFLGDVQWDVANYCGDVTQNQEYPFPEQRGAWLEWLKQEATT